MGGAQEAAHRRDKHWNGPLVLTVGLPEVGQQVPLFEPGTDDNPCGPEHVEEELVGGETRSRPDEQEHKEVERMANVTIGTLSDKRRRRCRSAAQGRLERERAKRIKSAKGLDAPGEAGNRQHRERG